MSTGIANAVASIVMRQIVAVGAGVKRKLQNLHARIAGFFQQLFNAGGHQSEVFCDNRHVAQALLHSLEELHLRAVKPLAVNSIFCSVGNRIELIKGSEVVDSGNVKHFGSAFNSSDPPVKACFLQIDPVIQGVAPKLTCFGEKIRRTSCHANRLQFVVQPEHLGICPGIGAVHRYINRHITKQQNAVVIGILFQFFPLLEEKELNEFPEHHVLIQIVEVVIDGIGISVLDQMIGPFCPGLVLEQLFHCHIQGIVCQPAIFVTHKVPVFLLIS